MRKSFTRLFSIFVLLCVLGFQALAANITWDKSNSTPKEDGVTDLNVKPETIATQFVVAFSDVPVISDAGGTLAVYEGAVLLKTIVVSKTSSAVSIVGKTLVVKHGGITFTEGHSYSIVLTASTLTNLPSGITGTSWDFTIGDYSAPVLSSTAADFSPAKGAVSVATPFTLTVPFNEPVKRGTGNVTVYSASGVVLDIIKITPNADAATANISLSLAADALYKELTSYYVTIDAGTFIDGSVNANKFAGLTSSTGWTFKTRDNSAPAITAKSISDVTINSAKLNITLSEAGKYYYKVQLASDADISVAADVQSSGTAVTVSAANTNVSKTVSSLSGSTNYEVFVVAQNAEASSPNLSADADIAKLTFTTVDVINPTLVSKGKLDVNKQTVGLKMIFNEKVQAGTGDLSVRDASTNALIATVSASAVTFAKEADPSTNWVATIAFPSGTYLDARTTYYVIFPQGYVVDMAGNKYLGEATTTTDWIITGSDWIAPTVVPGSSTTAGVSPFTVATATENLYVHFSEDGISLISGTLTNAIVLEKNNAPVSTTSIAWQDGTNKVIVIDPVADFDPNATYTVFVRPNLFQDPSANILTTETVLSYKTGDFAAPVMTVSPTATGVEPTATFTVTFNKAAFRVATGSPALTDVLLKQVITFKQGATDVPFSVAYNSTTNVGTITPTASLGSEKIYTMTVDASGIKDSKNVVFGAGIVITTYTVKDYVAPTATFSHTGNTYVAAPLKITFSEPIVTGANTTYTFKEDGPNGKNLSIALASVVGNVYTFTTPALVYDKTYYYGISEVSDVAGNKLEGGAYTTFTYKTTPVDPDIKAVTYQVNGGPSTDVADVATGVAPVSNFVTVVVTFDHSLQSNGGTVLLKQAGGTVASAVLGVGQGINGETLTFAFSTGATLLSSSDYTIEIPAGIVQGNTLVKDVNNNDIYAQFAGKTITVKSKDTTAPTAVLSPVNGVGGVALNATVKLTFDEKVVIGTGNIVINNGTADEFTIPVGNVTMTEAGGVSVATISHTAFSMNFSTYTVTVPATAFKDLTGNAYVPVAWSFATLANTAPTAMYLPLPGSDNLALSPLTLTITFNKPVAKYDVTGSGTHKEWWLIEKKDNIVPFYNTDNSLNLNSSTDVVKAHGYIENSNVGVSGNVVTITTAFTPEANKDYYVYINDEAFYDQVLPATQQMAYGGIEDKTTWYFSTKDVNSGTVDFSFTNPRDDGKVATNADLIITFSRPIKKADGSAINNVDIANIFSVIKNPGGGEVRLAATGVINSTKTVVTIQNASLVSVGEFVQNNDYQVKYDPQGGSYACTYANGAVITGASKNFTTSDYSVPTISMAIANTISDIIADKATVNFSVSDNVAGSDLAKLYYVIQSGNITTDLGIDVITGSTPTAISGLTASVTKQFTGLTAQSAYTVFAVAVDKAGNTSTVANLHFTTDDVTAPTLVDKSTSFDSNGKLTLTFSEKVQYSAAAGLGVRVFNNETGDLIGIYGLSAVSGQPTKLITPDILTVLGLNAGTYNIEIDGAVVTDYPVVTGDAVRSYAGLYGKTAWVVSTTDRVKPTMLSIAPSGSAVAISTLPTATFDENIAKVDVIPVGAFVLEVYNGTGFEPYEVIDGANVTAVGTVATITPSRGLVSNTQYRLTVKSLAFKDVAGNVANDNTMTTTFTMADVVAPVAVFSPANSGTVAVADVANDLTISFGEAIRLLDNSDINRYDLDSLVWFKKGTASMEFVPSYTAGTITINPKVNLVQGETYSYGFKAKFEDLFDNAIAAKYATFIVAKDPTAPVYVTYDPTYVAPATYVVVPIDQEFTITFSGPIYQYSVSYPLNNLPVDAAYLQTALTLTKGGVDVPFTASISSDYTTVIVSPKSNLDSEGVYVLSIVADKLQITQGPTSTVLGGATSYVSFRTYKAVDVAPPTVVTYTPVKVAAGVAAPIIAKNMAIKLTFNEPVQSGSGTIEIRHWDGALSKEIPVSSLSFDATKTIVTLLEPLDLTTNEEYYIVVPSGAIKDLAGNSFTGIAGIVGGTQNWKFQVKDDNVPKVTAYTPLDNNILVTTDLAIYFDRPVAIGSGFVAIYKTSGSAVQILRTTDVPSKFVLSSDKMSATVDIADLDDNTEYHIEVAAGTFVSDVDHSISQVGISKSDWVFTTEDNDPFVLTDALTFTPSKDAVDVALNQDLQITFNKAVKAGTGNVKVFVDGASTPLVSIAVTSSDVTFVDNVVTVALPILGEYTKYYVIVDKDAITNTSATPEGFVGITVPNAWSFTTGDFTEPTVTANPVDGTVDLPMTFDVTLTFSEKVTGVDKTTLTVSEGVINSVSTESTGAIYVVNITAPSLAKVDLTVPVTVKNVSGVALASVAVFNYEVGNFDAPVATGYTPVVSTIPTETDTTLVITFNKPVVLGTGTLRVYSDLNTLFKSFDVVADATVADSTFSIPITGLESETTYVVLYDAGIVKDAQGLANLALSDPTKWFFTTADFIAPTVSFSPNAASNLANQFEVSIVFSEDVVDSTVTDNVTVANGTLKSITGSGTTYTATIEAEDGAAVTLTVGTGVIDVSLRNHLAAEVVSGAYKVGDHAAPTVTVTPIADPVPTVFIIELLFDEPVSGLVLGTSGVTVENGKITDISGQNDSYTITVSAVEGAAVKVVIDGKTISDFSGNKFEGITLNYTIGDFTAPELVSMSPTNGETIADNHPTLKMTFSENVKLGAGGNLYVYKVNTTTNPVLSIPITEDMIAGNVVTVNYTTTSGLDKNVRYYVLVDGTAITDIAGNAFDGVGDKATWTFKTGNEFATEIVDPNSSLEFKVYPNPFVDFVNVVSASELSKIVVTNIAGQIVKEVVNPTNRIQLNELRSGIYFMSLYNTEDVIVKTAKIVKR